MYQQYCIQILM